jgi:hypothetical protein
METVPYVISADLHSAQLFRQALMNLLSGTGVVGAEDLKVVQETVPNLSVNIEPGYVIIPGTQGSTAGQRVNAGSQNSSYSSIPTDFTTQGVYHAVNPAKVNLTLSEANATNPRIDLIVASVQDAFYSGSFNQALLQVVTGTPAASPSPPTPPENSVVLAQVEVKAKAKEVKTANITSERPGLIVGSTVDFGASLIATEQETASTSYTTLPTADEVTLILPEKGLIAIALQATWQSSATGRGALFLNENELLRATQNNSPESASYAAPSEAKANKWASLYTTPFGLATTEPAGTGYTGDVTTGQIIGGQGGEYHNSGGPVYVFAAAGTYKISLRVKAEGASAKLKVKNRRLYAWIIA